MRNGHLSNKSFLEWTRQVNAQHPDILEYMLKCTVLLDRVIAKRIIQIAECGKND